MEPLTAKIYLLGYDPRRRRIAGGGNHGLMVRAAALEELRLAGAIADDAGKVRAGAAPRPDDPVLASVLQEISAAERPRPWKYWVTRKQKDTCRAVRDRLEDSLVIRVEPHRVLGIFAGTRVYVRDPRAVDAVRAEVDRVLTAPGPAEPAGAALVALAATGGLGTILPRARRRQFKDRITQLTAGPVPPALRRAIRDREAASAAGSV